MTDWGLEKDFLHSSRKNMWNNDYFEFLVKCVWNNLALNGAMKIV